MSNQDFASGTPRETREGGGMTGTAKDALSKASDIARQAAEKAKQTASDSAATVSQQVKQQVKEQLDRQIGSGADTIGHFASSAKRAAQDLEQDAPQLAGAVRSVAAQIESYADDLRDKSVDELVRSASDFTRRQPALVFGLAALAGFFVFRTIKSAPPRNASSFESPTLQPTHES